jgi:hypothetical protein
MEVGYPNIQNNGQKRSEEGEIDNEEEVGLELSWVAAIQPRGRSSWGG